MSQVVTVIHQNHDYGHLPGKRLEAFHGSEAKQNRTFLKGHLAGSSANATHVLRKQTASPRVSIVLASRDDHLQDQTYLDFEVITVSESLPVVTAWNQGLEKAKGEFVLFLDAQACLLPNALTAWVEQIDAKVGALEMIFAGWQTAIESNVPTVIEPWHQLSPLLDGREGLQGLHVWSLPTIWFLLHPSSVLFRRDWLCRFGAIALTKTGLQPDASCVKF